MDDKGYVNYFSILELDENAKPGEVRKAYKRAMKNLVMEIARVQITEDRRAKYLLEMAKLNAALCVLRDNETREKYWSEREALIALEQEWREAVANRSNSADTKRRAFENHLNRFLSQYVEELMLSAGRDKECVEASHWDEAHERHAHKLLRQYQHQLYQNVLERLPFHQVTEPKIDWDERTRAIAALVEGSLARG